MTLKSKIESILFVASKPLPYSKIAKSLSVKPDEVESTIEKLIEKYNIEDSGIHILREGNKIQMSTNADNSDAVEDFVKYEVTGELTKAQLETLTVIAYRSPVTRPEVEEIRGVNCAVILRNLLIRGLIMEQQDSDNFLPFYRLSVSALAHLGITSTKELPNFKDLSEHEYLNDKVV